MVAHLHQIACTTQAVLDQLNEWASECPPNVRSARAEKRFAYLRTALGTLVQLKDELLQTARTPGQVGPPPESFWGTQVARSVQLLYQQDPNLDGVWVLIRKASATGKAHPNYAHVELELGKGGGI